MNMTKFIAEEFPKLEFFTKQIVKVHGQRHPELAQVRALFVQLRDKALAGNFDFSSELSQMESVTNHYAVPQDACEAYQATYELLDYLDNNSAVVD